MGSRGISWTIVVALVVCASVVARPHPALASTDGPTWAPLVTSEAPDGVLIGCVWLSSGDICEGTHHSYPAIDLLTLGHTGVPVHAAGPGTVRTVVDSCGTGSIGDRCGGGYGNHIVIAHPDGRSSVYAHLLRGSIEIGERDRVERGRVIARVGSSGSSNTPHLHYEERTRDGSRVDFGAMRALHGRDVVAYPRKLGVRRWKRFPGHRFDLRNDGYPEADDRAPVTRMDADPSAPARSGWTSGAWTVRLFCTDDGSGCAETTYVTDARHRYHGPVRFDDPGRNRLSYASVDHARNAERRKGPVLLGVDRTPPDVHLDRPPATAPAGRETRLAATAADDASDVHHVWFDICRQTADWCRTAPAKLRDGRWTASVRLDAGTHRVRAWAEDVAFNRRSSGDTIVVAR